MPEVVGADGMHGKDGWIGCYVWLNVPEVDGKDEMNGEDGWIGCYVWQKVPLLDVCVTECA